MESERGIIPNENPSKKQRIPPHITQEHIFQAIDEINKTRWLKENDSKKYDLLFKGEKFPPKVVVSIANKYANGIPLDFSEFSGGEQAANKFLKDRGFEIVLKKESNSDFEYESYSWKILSNLVAIKRMDKSSFLHHGTGIPIEIRSFFDIDTMKVGDKRQIVLSYGTTKYPAHFEMVNKENPRTRLLWRSNFQQIIQNKFPEWLKHFQIDSNQETAAPILIIERSESKEEYLVLFSDGENPAISGSNAATPQKTQYPAIVQMKISSELVHRMAIWNQLRSLNNAHNLSPDLLREKYRIYRGAAGIWCDKDRTTSLSDDEFGIAVSVLNTGKSYPDEIGENSIIYHYPVTDRSGNTDQNEINATKNSKKYHLPIFIITHSKTDDKKRDVRLGFVEDWNDDNKTFLIEFSEFGEQKSTPPPPMVDDPPFELTQKEDRTERKSSSQRRDPAFRFKVLKRYGLKCAVCSIIIENLLSAAHIRPKEAKGTDDARNGLVLCHNHHRAFDDFLFSIDPITHKISFRSNGPFMNELKIDTEFLSPLRESPHVEALEWRNKKFHDETTIE